MRVNFAIILDPIRQLGKNGLGVGQNADARIIALERLHEAFRHAVAFGAAHGREEERQSQGAGCVRRVFGDVGAAIVGKPFHAMRRLEGPEAAFDSRDHQIAHHLAGHAAIGDCRPGDDFAIAGVDDEKDARTSPLRA